MNSNARPQHIGVLACSTEGASLCYQTICLEGKALSGEFGHPKITMHTHPYGLYVDAIARDEWREASALMLDSARKLARIGADFLICPDNTIHRALPYIEYRLPLPWLHIADAVADAALERGYRRVALTGTRWLVESDVYSSKLTQRGIASVRAERRRTRSCIYAAIEGFERDGCDAVVLGCTELPIIVEEAQSALPTLDSTRLLSRAALRRAL